MKLYEEARGSLEGVADLLAALLPPRARASDKSRAALLWIAEVGSKILGLEKEGKA